MCGWAFFLSQFFLLFFFPVSLMFTFSPNQNLIASLPITVSPPPPPPTAAAIFVACWMAWVTGRERFWRLAASRLVAHLVRLFLSFKQYEGRKRLLVLRLNIKVAVVRRTLLLVGRVLIPHFLSFSQKTSVIAILPIIPYPSLILANPASRVAVKSLDCEKVLERSDGGAGQERRTCNYVSGIWIPPPIPLWLPVDWAVRFPPINAKRKQVRM